MYRMIRPKLFFAMALLALLVSAFFPIAAGAQSESWRGEYFSSINLTGSPVVREDTAINFNWGAGTPMAGLPADDFSVRWTRPLYFEAGRYRFTTESDDGVRLFVDGALVIDQWREMAARYSSELYLAAGTHTVRLEYFEQRGGAMAQLNWSRVDAPT
ncbi:MAG: PA14 domain-containing protein, partial [Candidatus Binatia bacterium]